MESDHEECDMLSFMRFVFTVRSDKFDREEIAITRITCRDIEANF